MNRNRPMAQKVAEINGYFWLPCPACGQHFGGQQWCRVNGHENSLPYNWESAEDGTAYVIDSKALCPDCTASGVGCRAYARLGLPTHADCTFIATTTQPTELHNGHAPLP